MAVNITKEMTMGELLSIDRGVAVVLMNAGMHCIGCPSSIGESLEEACMVHGIDCETLVNQINEVLADRQKKLYRSIGRFFETAGAFFYETYFSRIDTKEGI